MGGDVVQKQLDLFAVASSKWPPCLYLLHWAPFRNQRPGHTSQLACKPASLPACDSRMRRGCLAAAAPPPPLPTPPTSTNNTNLRICLTAYRPRDGPFGHIRCLPMNPIRLASLPAQNTR